MKTLAKRIAVMMMLAVAAVQAHAQWYDLANQATNMIGTALRGGFNYRGTIDAGYTSGIGNKRADMLEFSTTQGLKYNDHFFMGVGAGIDVVWTTVDDGSQYHGDQYKQSSVLVPLYTDFRYNFGQPASTGFFIDARLGAAFWVSNDKILVGDGYINSGESFYLRPGIGFRVPLSSKDSRYALNISAHYQLLTNSRWYNPYGSRSVTLNGFGATIGFEW